MALMLPLDGIKDSQILGLGPSNIGDCYCWGHGLESLMPDKVIEVQKVHAEPDAF